MDSESVERKGEERGREGREILPVIHSYVDDRLAYCDRAVYDD